MSQARTILASLGFDRARCNERSALTLLALAGLSPGAAWADATDRGMRTVDLMEFMRLEYGKRYRANTRETIRRQTLHQFLDAGLVELNADDPDRPTNSGFNRYSLSRAGLEVLRAHGSRDFDQLAAAFVARSLATRATGRGRGAGVDVSLPSGARLRLSPGQHNSLQKAVLELFLPRFAPGAVVLYIGDTARKHLHVDVQGLDRVGIRLTEHDKLPDIILHEPRRNWIYLVEAVTSHGPMTPLRVRQLTAAIGGATAGLVYVTAFPTRAVFRRHAADIAWETEVWIADEPDHLIHFNGDRFLGPHQRSIGPAGS